MKYKRLNSQRSSIEVSYIKDISKFKTNHIYNADDMEQFYYIIPEYNYMKINLKYMVIELCCKMDYTDIKLEGSGIYFYNLKRYYINENKMIETPNHLSDLFIKITSKINNNFKLYRPYYHFSNHYESLLILLFEDNAIEFYQYNNIKFSKIYKILPIPIIISYIIFYALIELYSLDHGMNDIKDKLNHLRIAKNDDIEKYSDVQILLKFEYNIYMNGMDTYYLYFKPNDEYDIFMDKNKLNDIIYELKLFKLFHKLYSSIQYITPIFNILNINGQVYKHIWATNKVYNN